MLAPERGANRPIAAPSRQPLIARNPLQFWKVVAALSLLANLLLLLVFMR